MVRIICLMFISILFSSTNVMANSSSYYDKDGVTVFPMENDDIVMQKEIVKIAPDKEDHYRWVAVCDFIFLNSTKVDQIVTMGYPDWVNSRLDFYSLGSNKDKFWEVFETFPEKEKKMYKEIYFNMGYGYSDIYAKGYQQGKMSYVEGAWNLRDLKVTVDLTEVSVTHRPIGLEIPVHKKYEKEFSTSASMPVGAYIWKTRFKPYESKLVRVKFSFSGLTDPGCQEVSYILKTGALWADKIGEADIFWNISGRTVDMKNVSPQGFQYNDNVIHWHFKNFEPNEDISIFVGKLYYNK